MPDGDRREVVVTGLGLVTPVGVGVDVAWPALLAGTPGGALVTRFEVTDEYPSRVACEIKGFDPSDVLDAKESRRYDLFAQYAIVAAAEAMSHAGLDDGLAGVPQERVGVLVGSGIGGMATFEENARLIVERGPSRVSPFFVPMYIVDIAAGLISIRFGAKGPNYATVSACASSAHAIGDAARLIERGDADIMVAGGAEAAVTPLTMAGFGAMKALSRRNDDPAGASRPFDAMRDGFVLGEGAGIVILEAREVAEARGARIHGHFAGFGMSADAYHITSPAPGGEGARSAMQLALSDAGAEPSEVDYINAHGTSTQQNDKSETLAVRAVLGDAADNVVMGSTKSMTGHLLGAAGAVEAVICVLACREGRIPPTINLEHPDPDCDLDYAPEGQRERPVGFALSNSFGFGGHNACLAFRR